MKKFQLLYSLVIAFLCCPFAKAAIQMNGTIGAGADDGIITLLYDPANGRLEFDSAGKELTALEILSAGGNFTGTKPPQANGLFDVFTPTKFFILKPGASRFGDQDFGALLAPGLTMHQIAADLTVGGALFPRGGLGVVDMCCTPEPSSAGYLTTLMLGLIRGGRRKSTCKV